jgi:hypothetical protein
VENTKKDTIDKSNGKKMLGKILLSEKKIQQ